jgi:hypothetical protein
MCKYAPLFLRVTFVTLLACAGGCVAVAAALDKAGGDPKEPAKYKPEQQNLAVLVEDYANPAVVELLADHMDQLIGEELIANKVAPVVNPEKLTVFRLDHPDTYKKLKIPAIGEKLGARQVLYVNVTDFTVTSAGGTELLNGHAEARVKLVDCITGSTLWPRDATSAGYPIVVELPFDANGQDVSAPTVREAVAKVLSSKVARLFYDATIDQPDPAPKYPESDLK